MENVYIENKKRTFKLFKNTPEEEPEILKKAIQIKLAAKYNDEYRKPTLQRSILTQTKRNKILQSLGVILSEKQIKAEEEEKPKKLLKKKETSNVHGDPIINEEEEKLSDIHKMVEQIPLTNQDVQLEKIPERFRIKDKKEETLSLVSVLDSKKTHQIIRRRRIIQPKWHAPWKLMRVISG